MIAYIKGTVVYRGIDRIIIDNNGIGYEVYVSDVSKYELNSEMQIFTYQHLREDANILFGFQKQNELDLFMKLISVKGIGPKIAINAIGKGGANNIVKAIEENDANFLKSLPGIGAKASSQIVLDLKGKLVVDSANEQVLDPNLADAIEGLKTLGYKQNEINKVLKHMTLKEASVDEYIKEALKIISNK